MKKLNLDSIRNRNPARRIIDIPDEVQQALSLGLVPSMNLTEWLASDRVKLLSTVCTEMGSISGHDPAEVGMVIYCNSLH